MWVLRTEVGRALDRVKNLLISLIIYPQSFSCYHGSGSWKMNLGVACCQEAKGQHSMKEMLSSNTAQPWYLEDPVRYSRVFPIYTDPGYLLCLEPVPVFKRKVDLHKSTIQLNTATGKIHCK